MKSDASIVTLHGNWATFALYDKVTSDGSSSVANECVGSRVPLLWKELVEQIIQSSLGGQDEKFDYQYSS